MRAHRGAHLGRIRAGRDTFRGSVRGASVPRVSAQILYAGGRASRSARRSTMRCMAATPKAKPRGPWTPEEIARNERAVKARVARDSARGPSANLEDVIALSRFANRFAEAFRDARHT